jgi:hypothetical protein
LGDCQNSEAILQDATTNGDPSSLVEDADLSPSIDSSSGSQLRSVHPAIELEAMDPQSQSHETTVEALISPSDPPLAEDTSASSTNTTDAENPDAHELAQIAEDNQKLRHENERLKALLLQNQVRQ